MMSVVNHTDPAICAVVFGVEQNLGNDNETDGGYDQMHDPAAARAAPHEMDDHRQVQHQEAEQCSEVLQRDEKLELAAGSFCRRRQPKRPECIAGRQRFAYIAETPCPTACGIDLRPNATA